MFQDSPAITVLNGSVTSDNTNKTYNSTISEIAYSKVAGPLYDIGEMADMVVEEFEKSERKIIT